MKTKKTMSCLTLTALGCFISYAESSEDKAAQVYDVKVAIKTTVAKTAKVSASKNPFVSESDSIVYRAQGSQSWGGVIWGCSCDSILGEWAVINQNEGIVAGCVIWNKKSPHTIIFDEDIHWRLLNAIDKNGTKCEGAWTIGDSGDDSNAFLSFAGFGTLAISKEKTDGDLVIADCMSYIKTISGNVAGWMPAPYVTIKGKKGSCTFCHAEADEEDEVNYATAWNFCECAEFGDSDFTAVYGTWSIKYNASLSKKLRDSTSILDVYTSFPDSVASSVAEKITETLGE